MLVAEQQRSRALLERLEQGELQSRHSLALMQMQYESKIRGMLPEHLRQELEATILALKEQARALEQRTVLLQRELAASRPRQ